MAENTNIVKAVSASIKEVVERISSNIKGVGQDISGKLREVMSEELQELADTTKQVYNRLVGFLTPIFQPFNKFFKEWFKNSVGFGFLVKYVRRLVGLEEIRRKEELARKGLTVKGFFEKLLEWLLIPVGIILALIAGVIRRILWPLEMLWKAMMMLKLFRKIPIIGPIIGFFIDKLRDLVSFFIIGTMKLTRTLGFFRKIKGYFETFYLKVLYWYDDVLKLIAWMKKLPLIGPAINMLFKSLKFGFKIFGWPLQILLSAIDFISGFKKEKGNLLAKVKAGVKNVIVKFVEFPVEILGKLFDMVLGWFGVKNAQSAQRIKDVISKGIDFLFDLLTSPLKTIIDMVKAFTSTDGTLWQKAKASIDAGFKTLLDLPVRMFASILGFFGGDDVAESIKKRWESFSITGAVEGIFQAIRDVFLTFQAWIYNMIKNNPVIDALVTDKYKESLLSKFGDDVKEKAKQMEESNTASEAEEVRKREEERLALEREQTEIMRQQLALELEKTGKNDVGGGLSLNMSNNDGRAPQQPSVPPPAAMPSTRQVNSDPLIYGESMM